MCGFLLNPPNCPPPQSILVFFSDYDSQSLLKKQKETETDVAVFGYDETSPSTYVNMDCMMKEEVLPNTCRSQQEKKNPQQKTGYSCTL